MFDEVVYLDDKSIKEALLNILIKVDIVLKEHRIRYSLDSGTLLGAVRHKGFIPWDDDIDIIVPRPDYNELMAHPEWFAPELVLVAPGDGPSIHPFAKVIDRSLRAQEPLLNGVTDEYLWIDIFPVDAIPENQDDAEKLCRRQIELIKRYQMAIFNHTARGVNDTKTMLKAVVQPVYRAIFPPNKTLEKLMQNETKYEYGSTPFLTNLSWPSTSGKSWIPMEDFDSLIEMPFECHSFSCIPHWDDYLTGLYGDYMIVPDENQRESHCIRVWTA